MLPVGLKLELYPMGPGAAREGRLASSHPHPVVRASVRTPYLPKLLAGLPVPQGWGSQGRCRWGLVPLGWGCGSAGPSPQRGERGSREQPGRSPRSWEDVQAVPVEVLVGPGPVWTRLESSAARETGCSSGLRSSQL